MTFELAPAPSPRDRARKIARESVQKIPDAELKRPKRTERRFNKILEELSDQEEALVVKSTYDLVALLARAARRASAAAWRVLKRSTRPSVSIIFSSPRMCDLAWLYKTIDYCKYT